MQAATLDPRLKPRLRGVLHQWAFAVSLLTGVALVLEAGSARARVAVAVYALSVAALFGTSALYHRVNWRTLNARRWVRRLDHTMIFVLIAGTYTPFGLLVLQGTLGTAILIAVWCAALAGAVFKLVWIDAPGWLGAATYVSIGWIALVAAPELLERLGIAAVGALALGGVLYSVGAVIYAHKRPDPVPTVFGYHELFHLLVIVAAALQYAVVAFWVL
ncbi:MAG TPA: hemolysin III family protein [Solirubrobacteraceae bacterium]|nr:hemolysin III family protein [Solirubrobacteraceae bacterium]